MKKPYRLLFVAGLLFAIPHVILGQEENLRARLFDSYGWANSEDGGARADNFAIALQNEPDKIGYIISYGPEGEGSGTGGYQLHAIEYYLVNVRGIDSDRIRTISGGRYKDPRGLRIEFWLGPQGAEPPEPRHYENKLGTVTGKFTEFEGWDGIPDGDVDGVRQGNVTLAAFSDALRQQPNTTAYIVAFNEKGATPGTWRRIAKAEAADLQTYGIGTDRIKIIYGGTAKGEKRESEDSRSAMVQLWILPSDAPPPVREAKPERTPKKAARIGSYSGYLLKYPEQERRIFEGFADVLRADEQLNVYIVVRPQIGNKERNLEPGEPPDIDPLKLVQQWKSELTEKLGVNENCIMVIPAAPDEFLTEGTVEVWVIPPGAPLPDLSESQDEPMPNEEPPGL